MEAPQIAYVSTVMECYNAAKGSYRFFGLEAGSECHATNNYYKATQYPATVPCDWKCSGDGGNCGAGWTLAMYVVGSMAGMECGIDTQHIHNIFLA